MALQAHLWLEGTAQGVILGSCDLQGREGSILVQEFVHEDPHALRSTKWTPNRKLCPQAADHLQDVRQSLAQTLQGPGTR